MDIKRKEKWYVECGRGHFRTKKAAESAKKNYERRYDIECIIEKIPLGTQRQRPLEWKLFCRGK